MKTNYKLILHIGLMKTGTTYIQNILSENRKVIKKNGWIYPGDLLNQQHAFYNILKSEISWIQKNYVANQARGEALIKLISEPSSNMIVSSEALSSVSQTGVDILFKSIKTGFSLDNVHVIVTARSISKLIPSFWQQALKTGTTENLEEYTERFISGYWDPNTANHRIHNIHYCLSTWSTYINPKNMHLVIVPDKENTKETLWETFSKPLTTIGFKALVPTITKQKNDNVSFSMLESIFLQLLNKKMKQDSFSESESEELRQKMIQSLFDAQKKKIPKMKISQYFQHIHIPESLEDADFDFDKINTYGNLDQLKQKNMPETDLHDTHSSGFNIDEIEHTFNIFLEGILFKSNYNK